MAIGIYPGLPCQISSVLIYYGPQPDIQVKSYGRLNLPRALFFNFEHLDILWVSIRHPSKKLWPFEFVWGFLVEFRASWNIIMGLNRTSESKVIADWIFPQLPFSILSILYVMGLNRTSKSKVMPIKIYPGSIFEYLYTLWASIKHPCKKLWLFEFF